MVWPAHLEVRSFGGPSSRPSTFVRSTSRSAFSSLASSLAKLSLSLKPWVPSYKQHTFSSSRSTGRLICKPSAMPSNPVAKNPSSMQCAHAGVQSVTHVCTVLFVMRRYCLSFDNSVLKHSFQDNAPKMMQWSNTYVSSLICMTMMTSNT